VQTAQKAATDAAANTSTSSSQQHLNSRFQQPT
jgi:hypothetical protein